MGDYKGVEEQFCTSWLSDSSCVTGTLTSPAITRVLFTSPSHKCPHVDGCLPSRANIKLAGSRDASQQSSRRKSFFSKFFSFNMGLFDRGIHGREREGRERERDTLTHPLTHTYTDTYTYTHPLTHTHTEHCTWIRQHKLYSNLAE